MSVAFQKLAWKGMLPFSQINVCHRSAVGVHARGQPTGGCALSSQARAPYRIETRKTWEACTWRLSSSENAESKAEEITSDWSLFYNCNLENLVSDGVSTNF